MKKFGEALLCALVIVLLIIGTPIIMLVNLVLFWARLFKRDTYTVKQACKPISYDQQLVICRDLDNPIWRGSLNYILPDEVLKMEVLRLHPKDGEIWFEIYPSDKNWKLIKQLNRTAQIYTNHIVKEKV